MNKRKNSYMKKASLASVLTLSVLATAPLAVSASEDIEVQDSTELSTENISYQEPMENETEVLEDEDEASNGYIDTFTEEDELDEEQEINEEIISEDSETIVDEIEIEEQIQEEENLFVNDSEEAEVVVEEPEVEAPIQEESIQEDAIQGEETPVVNDPEDAEVIVEDLETEEQVQVISAQENQIQEEEDFFVSGSEESDGVEEWYSEDASPAEEGEYLEEEWDEIYDDYYEVQEDPYNGETVVTGVGILDAGSNDIIETFMLFGENYQEQLESYLENTGYEAVRDIAPLSYTEEVEYDGETFTRTFNNLTIFVVTDDTVMETYYDDVDAREAMRTVTIHHDSGIFDPYSYVASETIDDSIRYALYNMEHVFGGQFTVGHIEVSTGYGTKTFESGESYTGHLYDIQIYLGDSYKPGSEDESAEGDDSNLTIEDGPGTNTEEGRSNGRYIQGNDAQLPQQGVNLENGPVIPSQRSNQDDDSGDGSTESHSAEAGYSAVNVEESKETEKAYTTTPSKVSTQMTEDGIKEALADSTSENIAKASETGTGEVLPDTGIAGNNIIIPAAVMMFLGSAFIFFTRRKRN